MPRCFSAATRTMIIGLTLTALVACDRHETSMPAPPQPVGQESVPLAAAPPAPPAKGTASATKANFTLRKLPFHTPIEPAVSELTSAALSTWRDVAPGKPTLVLFSVHPLLDPLPDDLRPAIRNLVLHGTPAEIADRGRFLIPNPLLLPPQTVSAAIDTGLLGELVLVLPRRDTPAQVNLLEFQQRAVNAGFLTETEALALTLKDGTISGHVRGLPLRVVHPANLPCLPGPVIVHIDLGYFKDLFVNHIKTPLYDLLFATMNSIREAAWPTVAVTLSYSNQEVGFSLDTRFMISNLATVLRQPELLDGGTPLSWTLRAQAAKASALFAESDYQDLLVEAAAATPDDPAAHYALAMALFQQKLNTEGFASLERAIALDNGYALAYLELSDRGEELGLPEKAVELIKRAAQLLPTDPFIRIRQANLLYELGRYGETMALLNQLNRLPWDASFHPDIPPLLAKMTENTVNPPRPQGKPLLGRDRQLESRN